MNLLQESRETIYSPSKESEIVFFLAYLQRMDEQTILTSSLFFQSACFGAENDVKLGYMPL
jgi:hypothetical protein